MNTTSAVRKVSQAGILRAMANNYPENTLWDKLDALACTRAAEEIESLQKALEEKEKTELILMKTLASQSDFITRILETKDCLLVPRSGPQDKKDHVAILVNELKNAVTEGSAYICAHEETHRAGVIWEVCDQCGMKWADDRGGKPKFKWPQWVISAQAVIDSYS